MVEMTVYVRRTTSESLSRQRDESVAFDHADRMGILEPIAAHLLSLGVEQRTTEEELTSWFIEGTLHEEDAMLVCKPYIIKKGNNEPNIGGWRELATSIRSLWKDRQRREGTDHQPMVSAKAHAAVAKPAIACYICGGSHFSKECQASTCNDCGMTFSAEKPRKSHWQYTCLARAQRDGKPVTVPKPKADRTQTHNSRVGGGNGHGGGSSTSVVSGAKRRINNKRPAGELTLDDKSAKRVAAYILSAQKKAADTKSDA
jgi:hypothetical protein